VSTCVVSPRAALDLEQAHDAIAQHNPRAAAKFLDAVEAKFQTLATFPEIGGRCEDVAAGLRCLPVKRYLIFYRLRADGVEVVRVLHGSRDVGRLFAEGPD
jgi:toxin ParE1/3/4